MANQAKPRRRRPFCGRDRISAITCAECDNTGLILHVGDVADVMELLRVIPGIKARQKLEVLAEWEAAEESRRTREAFWQTEEARALVEAHRRG